LITSLGRTVKGLNILNCLYQAQDISVPVAFEIISKPILYGDIKTRQVKRYSEITKNDLMRQMLQTWKPNQLRYKYVLTDIWYALASNMQHLKIQLKKDFIMAMKSNRKVALSFSVQHQGHFVRIEQRKLESDPTQLGNEKGLDFPVLLTSPVFKNKDDSEGILYLVCSDMALTYDQITTIYQKRFHLEVFHKSIKSNTSLSKSPARTVKTQRNHVFASIYAAFKLEILKLKHHTNPFALKTKLYIKALQASFAELQKLSA